MQGHVRYAAFANRDPGVLLQPGLFTFQLPRTKDGITELTDSPPINGATHPHSFKNVDFPQRASLFSSLKLLKIVVIRTTSLGWLQ